MTPAQAAMWASTLSLAKTTGAEVGGTAEELWEQLPEMIRESWKAAAYATLEVAALACRSHPEDSEWDGYGASFEEAIRKLQETP